MTPSHQLLFVLASVIRGVAPVGGSASSCVCPDIFPTNHKYAALHSKSSSKVRFEPAPEATRSANYRRPRGNPTLYTAATSGKLAATSTDDCEAEQVHISLGNDINSVIVNFASESFNSQVYWSKDQKDLEVTDWSAVPQDAFSSAGSSSGLHVATGFYRTHSELYYIIHNLINPDMGRPRVTAEEIRVLQDTSTWAYDPVTYEHYFNWKNVTEIEYGFGEYNNPDMYYQAPLLHTVELTELQAGQKYFYRVADSCAVLSFQMPPFYYTGAPEAEKAALYPFSLGLTGDLGQTDVSLKSMEALAALEADAVLLVGDLSYADGYGNSWDTFGRAFEALASHVPVLTTGGNHEVGSGEAWLPYQLRYPTPYQGSGSPDPAYWGREVGPVHVIALNAYADSNNNSLQFRWVADYLETKVNRDRTPWVVVMVHAAWYCSNTVHWKEAEKMRVSMEPLLYSYGVDIVLSGHVHAYERTTGVYLEELNECGPAYLVLGDGGNYEAEVTPWREDPSTASGMPVWSAFRESSFGVGELTIVNSTHASYSWHRHACGSDSAADYHMNFSSACYSPDDNSAQKMETSDEVWFVRPGQGACPNRHVTSSHEVHPSQSDPSSSDDSDDDTFGFLTKDALYAITASLLMLCFGLLATVAFLWNKLSVREADLESVHNGDYKGVFEEEGA